MTKSLSQKLADNLAYYVADPAKRRCSNDTECSYSGKTIGKNTTVGCFVGRLLSVKDRIIADDNVASVKTLIKLGKALGIKLPKIIRENENIMYSFQVLHDQKDNWSEKGLSLEGKANLKNIINKHDLDEKCFEKFLAD